MRTLIIAIAALFALPSTGWATDDYENYRSLVYQGYCLDAFKQEPTAMAGMCLGFVDGVRQEMEIRVASSADKKQFLFCPPHEVTNGEMIKVWMKALDNHPEQLHEFAIVTFTQAMMAVYPCPAQ